MAAKGGEWEIGVIGAQFRLAEATHLWRWIVLDGLDRALE